MLTEILQSIGTLVAIYCFINGLLAARLLQKISPKILESKSILTYLLCPSDGFIVLHELASFKRKKDSVFRRCAIHFWVSLALFIPVGALWLILML